MVYKEEGEEGSDNNLLLHFIYTIRWLSVSHPFSLGF